ncbi:MAG: alpha/beta hydrolase [Cyanothece sp. SIO1E1]|nr:alpha/beta hydrolase [Cyanothece sp. SIO1E1]
MPYVHIHGVDHYYKWISTSGEGQPTGKPVMVFLHGWGGSTRYWVTTAQALQAQFDCLLYDLRGFGQSRLPKDPKLTVGMDYALESYADDLAALLDAFQIDQIYLNAHSAGASIAVFFLNRYAARVQRAILTCHGLLEYDEKAFKAFHQFSRYIVAFRPSWLAKLPFAPRLFMARFLHRPLPKADSLAFLEDFLIADYEAALGTVYTSVSKKATEVMPLEYEKLAMPTLLVSGQYDQIIQAEMGRQAAALNDNVEYVLMADTGHFPMLEDSERYLHHVKRFLES